MVRNSSSHGDSSVEITANAHDSDEITLKELILMLIAWWKYLLSRWIVILIGSLIGASLGLAYTYSKKPHYTAELTFVLEGDKQNSGIGNYAGLASMLGIGMGGNDGEGVFEGQNFLALMVSRSMIEKALLTTVDVQGKRETLVEYYIGINNLREKWRKSNSKLQNIRFLPGANPSKFSLDQNSLISNFHGTLIKNNLFVGTDKKSGFMFIKVVSEDELFSKYFVEVLAKEVSDFYVESKIKKSLNNLTILKQQADSVRQEFNAAISGVAFSLDANPNANPAHRSLGLPSQRRQVDAEANQAMLIELMKNLAISQISLRKETPLIQIVDRPVLPLAREDYSKMKGIITGGILGGLVIVLGLVFKKILQRIMV